MDSGGADGANDSSELMYDLGRMASMDGGTFSLGDVTSKVLSVDELDCERPGDTEDTKGGFSTA
uniref:CTNNB1 binding N-teminal domain-containing protein n=1 Tax=Schistosoma curassoni TaxID=6186 RepID=A0A183JWQ8_9TREM